MKGLIYMLPESVMWKKVFVKIKQNSRRICVILFDKLVGLQPANPESPTPVRPGRQGGGGLLEDMATHPPTHHGGRQYFSVIHGPTILKSISPALKSI